MGDITVGSNTMLVNSKVYGGVEGLPYASAVRLIGNTIFGKGFSGIRYHADGEDVVVAPTGARMMMRPGFTWDPSGAGEVNPPQVAHDLFWPDGSTEETP